MIGILYAIVIFIATFLGACVGLGGGVIIKPVLDFIGAHDLATISFLSTSAVFTMSVYSTIKQIKNHVQFNVQMILFVAFGAMVGGNLGSHAFSLFMKSWDAALVLFIQSSLLACLLIVVLVNINFSHNNLHVQNKALIFIIGMILGAISSFLGIGGGPINVAVFVFFFSCDMKTATVFSIATILFSQTSKLLTIAYTSGFGVFDLSLLLYTLPMAILGGIAGTYVNHRANENTVTKIFNIAVFLIILLNIYNASAAFVGLN